MLFAEFNNRLNTHFETMTTGHTHLFTTAIAPNVVWETYMNSFPNGTNEIYRVRREFDCTCCRHFMREFANVVAINSDNTITTIWDFAVDDATYAPVLSALATLVKSQPVNGVFVSDKQKFGTKQSYDLAADSPVTVWNHFYIVTPERFVNKSHKACNKIASEYRDNRAVLERSLNEISSDALNIVDDLIVENMLYRGQEWEAALNTFRTLKNEYSRLPDTKKTNWLWRQAAQLNPAVSRIRNHSMGVLLQAISAGDDVEVAVRKYEAVVAPNNYKQPKPIITKRTIAEAEATVTRLGLLGSLGRRYARLDDITVRNVLWANRDAKKHMGGNGGVFDMLRDDIVVAPQQYERAAGMAVGRFVAEVLPQARTIDVLLENRHLSNMVSLIAPQMPDSKTMFKWGNNFSWAYNGNMADSMKEHVKAAGGKVDGVLRFSLQWNATGKNRNDYDAHCRTPNGAHIYYGRKYDSGTRGHLDVDIIHPSINQVAVENITWADTKSMPKGVYEFSVHTYSHRGGYDGFDAEIEFAGQLFEFAYHKDLPYGHTVVVAKVEWDGRNFKLLGSLPTRSSVKNVWGLQTNHWQPVSTVLHSPNHWDGNNVGNKHLFFMLVGCINDTSPNGFYNEYLQQDLLEHKRVFAALGNKMQVTHTDDQLSGVGFAYTQRNWVVCRVDGKVVKVVF